jgi:hypothetical protein
MQACCEVRRLAHDPTFLGLPRADEIANYDKAGRHADAHLERLLDLQLAITPPNRQFTASTFTTMMAIKSGSRSF